MIRLLQCHRKRRYRSWRQKARDKLILDDTYTEKYLLTVLPRFMVLNISSGGRRHQSLFCKKEVGTSYRKGGATTSPSWW